MGKGLAPLMPGEQVADESELSASVKLASARAGSNGAMKSRCP